MVSYPNLPKSHQRVSLQLFLFCPGTVVDEQPTTAKKVNSW
jgi:hypothetical protein